MDPGDSKFSCNLKWTQILLRFDNLLNCTGWNQDPDVNEELITLHFTPCDTLEGPSKAKMEGRAKQTNMEGQAQQTNMEEEAQQINMEEEAQQTNMGKNSGIY